MAETVETLMGRLQAIVTAHTMGVARTPEKTGYRDVIDRAREDLFTATATVQAFGKTLELVKVEGTEFLRVVREDGKLLDERPRAPLVVKGNPRVN